jgi:hypothetical protein
MPRSPSTAVLTDRATLALFAALTAGWFLPDFLGPYAGVAMPLFLPAYLVSMVTYDGLLGLEHVVYAVGNALGGESALAWDAGLVVTYYLFAVVAALLARPLERRFGPEGDGGDGGDDAEASGETDRPTLRYVVAAALLVVGVLFLVQGVVVQPTVTSVSCTDSGSASEGGSAGTATATPNCTSATQPATGARLYGVGLGVVTGLLGAGVVAVDRRLAGRV